MEKIRLQKYLAMCGVASRRKAEELIVAGMVKVNDQFVTTLGTKVDPEKDKIEVKSQTTNVLEIIAKDGKDVPAVQQVEPEKKVYIMLNKPVGYVTTMNDEKGRSTVMELIKGVKERVVPVGRLDMYTSGLLLLSNDGEFIYQVTHPKHETTKTYVVKTRGVPKESDLEKLRNGIRIEEYVTSPAKVELLLKDNTNQIARIWIQIHEGRNRQVRKMCEAIGLSVIALKREGVGNLTCRRPKKRRVALFERRRSK